MLGSYPVLIDGEETGVLTVRKDGIMTVFEAQCVDRGTLVRLSVYGDTEGYLGVMLPDGAGKLHLRKRLSRAALAGFPGQIRYAACAGLQSAVEDPERSPRCEEGPPVCEEELPACEEPHLECEPPPPACGEMECEEETPQECIAEPEPLPEQPGLEALPICGEESSISCAPVPKPAPEPEPKVEPELRWRSGAGGALVGSCGDMRYLAVPLKTGVAPVGGNFEKRRISGIDYAVFEIKNGKII